MKVKTKKKIRKEKKSSISKNVLEIILAFVVAWLLYQGIAFATGTPMPIVSVVSHSMYHDKAFDNWWLENSEFYLSYNITKEEFRNFPMSNGLSRGDLLVVVKDEEPEIGDIIIYNKLPGFTIVHRIIEINGEIYITKGDNNPTEDSPVYKNQIVGKAIFSTPILGFPRLALYAVGI